MEIDNRSIRLGDELKKELEIRESSQDCSSNLFLCLLISS